MVNQNKMFIFPQSAMETGFPLQMRRAVNGRILYQVMKIISGNPNLAEKLDEKYNNFLLSYSIEIDPENLFQNIVIPYVGRIPAERIAKFPKKFEELKSLDVLIGDKYIEPIVQSNKRNPELGIRLSTILDMDSFGNLLNKLNPNYLDVDNLPKMFNIELIRKEEYIRQLANIFDKVYRDRTSLKRIVSDENYLSGLKSISYLSVLATKSQAQEMDTIIRYPLQNWAYYGDELDRPIIASERLHREAAINAIILCDKYLSEMSNG